MSKLFAIAILVLVLAATAAAAYAHPPMHPFHPQTHHRLNTFPPNKCLTPTPTPMPNGLSGSGCYGY